MTYISQEVDFERLQTKLGENKRAEIQRVTQPQSKVATREVDP
jgi:hypothetical protein